MQTKCFLDNVDHFVVKMIQFLICHVSVILRVKQAQFEKDIQCNVWLQWRMEQQNQRN